MEASAIRVEGSGEVQEKSEIPNWFEVPEPPLFTVGLDVPLKEIKLKLLEDGLTTISVWGVGGVGKTTLAKMLCHDQEVKDNFKEIFFTTASKWKNLNQKKERKPCLLVLDDIGDGSESILPEFDGLKTPNSKILITSRYAFPGVGSQYHLKSLNDEDAMSLFHHSASLGDRCSYIPEDLSRKIVECCKGLPLAITVNGRSLCGQPIEIWQKRIVEWGRGSSIFDTEPEMIVCLQRSFDALHREKTIIRECLFDLASFPEDQIIPAAALIDMWAELYGLDEEFWSIANLQKLTICGLVNIVSRKEEMEVDGYYSDLFVTLHHMLRGLAIHEASEDTIEQRNRLIIDIHGDNLPSWWTEQKYQPKNARLLSVSTDRAFSRKWQYMQVPKVEVLVLNFQTEKYELPDFLDKIDKLKVLIVTNYGSSPAQLSNLQLLGSLRNLKRIRLEGVSITSITKTPIQLDSLKKIAFTKCDMGQAFSNSSFQFSVAFPNLVEMYVEHCHDLKELPADLGNLSHLETLSISNCHSLSTLPEGIGNLSKLKRLRVRYGTNLVKFPGSIRKLNSLEFLDISGCIKIMGFPEDIGEMSRLRKLNISGCSRLKELPLSVLSLEQLQEVIMDEETENSWNPFLLKNIDTRVVPAIRDGKETLTTVKTANLQKVVSRVEERVLNIEAAIKQIQLKAKIEAWCAVPELPTPTVGLDGPLNELKMKLFNNGESMVVLTAAGGCGKTTLATKFCQDEQVQDKFKNNIFFVTVSKTRNFHQIVQELYRSKGNKAPTFKDDENALKWLQKFLREEGQNPLLLVLDDVWSGSDSLLAKFEFEMQDYKVLVTSRSEFPRYGSYALQSLDFDNAMELFRHAASLGERSLHIPPDISRQVVEGCKGFPLAITVAGKSLCGQPIEIWQERLIKWSEHSSILDSETELLLRLQTSLDVLNKEMRMVKECFLDLGSFPEDQRIPVAALIDIWTESYGSLDQDILCVANLHQVTNRSLANLVVTRKDQLQGDGYYSEHFVTQHDLLRELAIYETRQEDPGHRERLIINISKDNFPKWWSEQKYQCMKARLLSISTDGDFSTKWHDMELPVAEILVLNFQTKNYALPQFVEKMVKLKVLVVTNYGIVPSELTNFEILCTSSNLKRMRLERISIPSIAKHPMQLNSLQKISLFMCNIGQAFSNGSIQFSHAWPNLVEVNIDYCNDLVALPADTSDLIHLKKLSITNCHKLLALPEDIGKLAELELLRLRSCTGLAKLPGSTGKLKKLKSLDISYCFSIRELPEDFGELSSLRELNMRDCSRLQELPLSVSNLEHLKVIGDDETQSLWQPFLPIKGTNIVVAKENINLNWLPKFQF